MYISNMVFKNGGGGRGRAINIYCYMIEDKSFWFPIETLFRVEIIYMSELRSREYYLDVFFFRKERKCSSFFMGSGKETGFPALRKGHCSVVAMNWPRVMLTSRKQHISAPENRWKRACGKIINNYVDCSPRRWRFSHVRSRWNSTS